MLKIKLLLSLLFITNNLITMVVADDIYKYLGIAVVGLSLLYIVVKSVKMQSSLLTSTFNASSSSSFKEGLTSQSDRSSISGNVAASTALMNDSLNIATYSANYDDVLIKLHDNAKTFILSTVLNNAEMIAADPGGQEAQEVVERVVKMWLFTDALDVANNKLESDPNYKR